MYTDTVTIFNRSGTENQGFIWYPTTISNTDLNIDKGANIQKMGTDKADTAKLHIRYRESKGNILIEEKVYLPPKRWADQTDEQKSTTLTMKEGVDFFMPGAYPPDPIRDDDFITGTSLNGFYDQLNRKQDYVFRVTNVGGPYKLIPHFEIGGV